VLAFAKKYASSFHISEERWSSVFELKPGMTKKQLDDLRTGWDLVLDVDCPVREYSRLITHHLIQALRKHGVKSISCKFSGNKGFHIGVPYEAFPRVVGGEETRLWFPDKIKNILSYLAFFLDENLEFTNDLLKLDSPTEIARKIGIKTMFTKTCKKCNSVKKEKKNVPKRDSNCPVCQSKVINQGKYLECSKCGFIDKKVAESHDSSKCENCGSASFVQKTNPDTVMGLDALLISSRHMYRCVYSLHEKSGLVSVPVNPDKVLEFEKSMATPGLDLPNVSWLDTGNASPDETQELFDNSQAFSISKMDGEEIKFEPNEDHTLLERAVPVEFFPPCIQNVLSGLKDGRKRSMFILINFLASTGYEWETIEKILSKWNENNDEPLREVNLKGQVRYRRRQKDKILPPNCNNKTYYQDLRVCTPDNFCRRIKNPVNYAILKTKIASGGKKSRAKLTDEQKEMRRKFREKKKQSKS